VNVFGFRELPALRLMTLIVLLRPSATALVIRRRLGVITLPRGPLSKQPIGRGRAGLAPRRIRGGHPRETNNLFHWVVHNKL